MYPPPCKQYCYNQLFLFPEHAVQTFTHTNEKVNCWNYSVEHLQIAILPHTTLLQHACFTTRSTQHHTFKSRNHTAEDIQSRVLNSSPFFCTPCALSLPNPILTCTALVFQNINLNRHEHESQFSNSQRKPKTEHPSRISTAQNSWDIAI